MPVVRLALPRKRLKFRKWWPFGSASGRGRRRARQLIAECDLFDSDWYRVAHLAAAPDVEPIEHFLREGARRHLAPSPLFDPGWYARRYPDVGASHPNPLLHYVRWGAREGRATRSIGPSGGDERNLAIAPRPGYRYEGRLAIVVHAYYPDVFDDIAALLRNLPCRFSLFVSVTAQPARAEVLRSIKRHGVDADIVVKVCPNRGRNFGPFLAEFSTAVLRHEIVLHLHTKKSLYQGGEQARWRRDLYRGLLGSQELVAAILALFEEDAEVGVIYPAAFRDMPYWAHHALSNGHILPGLFARLGIDHRLGFELMDYPVGGMFWARVEAIRPLFTAQFDYDAFPAEAGQTDGTLAHAIERCIVFLARSRGYEFVEIDYANGNFRRGHSKRNLDQYLGFDAAMLRARIQAARLVSFDVFDTLVMRPSLTADSVQRFVGVLIERRFPQAVGFFALRKQAEQEARASKDHAGDVGIAEIYQELGALSGWSDDIVRAALDLELSQESRAAKPRPAGVEAVRFARAAGKRVIAMSDTYLPAWKVDELLRSVGLAGCFDELYVSSERRARKDRGDLWHLVGEAEGVPRSQWLHVGDNEHSDIQRACDLGIGFFHLMNPATLLSERGFAALQKAGQRRWGTDLVMGPMALRLGGDPFLPRTGFLPIAIHDVADVGYVVFGPLMFAFMIWLVRHPIVRDVERLFFLSREGAFLGEAYETIRRLSPQRGLPPATYLLASRQVVLAASQAIAFEPAAIVAGAAYRGTIGSLLVSRLGLETPRMECLDLAISLPDDRDHVIEVLGHLKPLIVAHGRVYLDRYRRYCAEEGMLGAGPPAVVDVGYSGTIHYHLQEILGRPVAGLYMATFEKVRDVERRHGSAHGCFSEGGSPLHPDVPLVEHALVVEAFLTACHGQLTGFAETRLGLKPVFKTLQVGSEDLAVIKALHAGAVRYAETLLRTYGPDLLDLDLDLAAVQEPLRLLADGQIVVPEIVRRALAVEDDFCGNGALRVGETLAAA